MRVERDAACACVRHMLPHKRKHTHMHARSLLHKTICQQEKKQKQSGMQVTNNGANAMLAQDPFLPNASSEMLEEEERRKILVVCPCFALIRMQPFFQKKP